METRFIQVDGPNERTTLGSMAAAIAAVHGKGGIKDMPQKSSFVTTQPYDGRLHPLHRAQYLLYLCSSRKISALNINQEREKL